MIREVRCWIHGGHDYQRNERIEKYTLVQEDDEIAAQCDRCYKVIWIDEVLQK